MTAVPRLAVVVVSYNTRDDLLRCLEALRSRVHLPHEVVVVDNASADGSVEAVRAAHPEVRLLVNEENTGFSRANNRGLAASSGEYVLILNSDAEVGPGAAEAMVALLDARPEVGIVGPRTVGGDGRVQVSFGPALRPRAEARQRRLVRGVRAGDPAVLREAEEASRREQEPGWVSGSCLMARRRALEAVGGFDEGFFLYEEDADLCLRVRAAGWKVVYTPAAEVVHHLGRSMERAPARARLEYHRSHLRYYGKHNGLAARLALRAGLLLRASLGWSAAALAGPGGRARRREAAALARLALLG